jgi:hypothetical protein
VGSSIGMKNSPGADLHRHENVKDSEGSGDRNEEIASNDGASVISHERRPTLIPCSPSRPE